MYEYPKEVLITGGKPAGGVESFAEALCTGFIELGVSAEVVPPRNILSHIHALRDPSVLKILSTTAVFAAPLARRCICMAHGFPCAAYQGIPTMLGVLASFRTANASRGSQLVAVSNYSAQHLRAIFNLRVDGVVSNPLQPLFCEEYASDDNARDAITFAGRMISAKAVDRLVPAIRKVLDERPGFRAVLIGDGPLRASLEATVSGDARFQFTGNLPAYELRVHLRRTRVFVSGNPMEAFGIVYLEALSQGCAVVMPASGGSLEIAPDAIGSSVFLFSVDLSSDAIENALRTALAAPFASVNLDAYLPRSVARDYLAIDSHFSHDGCLVVRMPAHHSQTLGERS